MEGGAYGCGGDSGGGGCNGSGDNSGDGKILFDHVGTSPSQILV